MDCDFVYNELLVLEKLNNFLLDIHYNTRVQRIVDAAKRAGIPYRIGEHTEEKNAAAVKEVESMMIIALRSCFFRKEDSVDGTFEKARILSYLCQENNVSFTMEFKDSPLIRLLRDQSLENLFNVGFAALSQYIAREMGEEKEVTFTLIQGNKHTKTSRPK